MGEHGRVGSEIMDSNGDQQINLGGRIDVDKLDLGIRGGNGKWECQHWTGSRN